MSSESKAAAEPHMLFEASKSGCFGGIFGLVLGLIGTILFSRSNLGPLAGLIMTGPVAAIAGLSWGTISATKRGSREGLVSALFLIWTLSLAYTLFLLRLSPRLTLWGVAAQLAGAITTVHVAWVGRGKPAWRRAMVASTCALAALLLMTTTLFPAVRPSRTSDRQVLLATRGVAFILDPRLDASKHPPMLEIRGSRICAEWAAILAGMTAFMLLDQRSRKSQAKANLAPD